VKLFITLNSFHTTTLAVLYFIFSYEKRQSLKSKIGSIDAIIFGNSLVFVHDKIPSLGALLHPYIKQFILLLCP
jgi:hypothetical protein